MARVHAHPFVDHRMHVPALSHFLSLAGCIQTAGSFVQEKNIFFCFGINRSEPASRKPPGPGPR
jgi:hypothetical protein